MGASGRAVMSGRGRAACISTHIAVIECVEDVPDARRCGRRCRGSVEMRACERRGGRQAKNRQRPSSARTGPRALADRRQKPASPAQVQSAQSATCRWAACLLPLSLCLLSPPHLPRSLSVASCLNFLLPSSLYTPSLDTAPRLLLICRHAF